MTYFIKVLFVNLSTQGTKRTTQESQLNQWLLLRRSADLQEDSNIFRGCHVGSIREHLHDWFSLWPDRVWRGKRIMFEQKHFKPIKLVVFCLVAADSRAIKISQNCTGRLLKKKKRAVWSFFWFKNFNLAFAFVMDFASTLVAASADGWVKLWISHKDTDKQKNGN